MPDLFHLSLTLAVSANAIVSLFCLRAIRGTLREERERNDRATAALLVVGGESKAAATLLPGERRVEREHPLHVPRQIGMSPR